MRISVLQILRKVTPDIYTHLLVFIVLVGLIAPTAIYNMPHGTDVYTHLVYTKIMSQETSLHDFYQECSKKGFLNGLHYPYGLWLFASAVKKVTTIDLARVPIVVPIFNLIVLIYLYYILSKKSLVVSSNLSKYSVISLIILLSIPIKALNIINYSSSIFFSSILIFVIYLILYEDNVVRKYALLIPTIFVFVVSHAGTTFFLLNFLVIFSIVFSFFNRKVNLHSIFLIILILLSYHLAITLTPWINEQYIDKGRLIISVGNLFYKISQIPLFKEMAKNVYIQIFVDNNILYYIFITSTTYCVSYLITFTPKYDEIKKRLIKLSPAAVPLGIRRLPHTYPFWVIWLNPIYVFLAVIGFFKAHRNVKVLLITLAIILLPSAYVAGARGLRELEYFFIILPVAAAQGFYIIEEKLREKISKSLSKKIFVFTLSLLFFLQAVTIVVLGNYLYFPLISLEGHERNGLEWLSKIGSPDEGATGGAYGDRIFVYGNKIPPDTTFVAAGAEAKRFEKDLYGVHFTNEKYFPKDLYSTFGVKYYILSERTFKLYNEKPNKIKMNENEDLDKIYSSKDIFTIYKYIPTPTKRVNLKSNIIFGTEPIIKDAGTSFLVKTEDYKVRISKEKPKIMYIGNLTQNYLGEGEEHIFLEIYDFKNSYFYVLDEDVEYEKVILGTNVLIYEGVLKGVNGSKIVSIKVAYEFFEHAFKRTIEVDNEFSSNIINTRCLIDLTLLANHFEFGGVNRIIKRTIYPNEDYSLIKDKKFSWIYISGSGNDGIYIKYEPTSQFPAKILYKGLVGYKGYALIRIYQSQEIVFPGERARVVQWFSLGGFEDAEKRVEEHTFVSLYLYPNGKLPLIVTGKIDRTPSDEWMKGFETLKEMGAREYILAAETNISGLSSDLKVKVIPVYNVKRHSMSLSNFSNGVYTRGVPDEQTFEVLKKSKVSYILGKVIPAPFEYLYEEGYRIPQVLKFRGEQTGIVLLPISSPTLDERNKIINRNKLIRVVDAASDTDGILVFKWNADMFNKHGNYEVIEEVVKYAKSKGYEFMSPERVAEHVKKLQNVTLQVSSDNEKIIIIVQNRGKAIDGLTLKVKLRNKPSAVSGAEIVREVKKDNTILVYLSTDIPPTGSKEIMIKP